MKASELYEQSLATYNKLPPVREFSPRVWNTLARAGFVNEEDRKNPKLIVSKLREAILTGTIWNVRNVGKVTVRLLCEWLEQKDASDTPSEEQPT